jgi:hypothetical protein
LISTLRGSTANDQIGSNGVRHSGMDFVVVCCLWDNGALGLASLAGSKAAGRPSFLSKSESRSSDI